MAIVRTDNNTQILSPDTKLKAVRVTDIILDPSHDRFEDYGKYDSIGTIFYTELNQSNPSTDSTAKPLFSFVKNYPLKNEVVLITSTDDKDNKISSYYFPLINIWNHPHHNALPYIETPSNNSNDYQQSIARKVEDGSTGINLGDYFQEKLNIKPLLPYEGDTIIEGRFGSSIRFGSTNISNKVGTPNGWSNVGELGDPITIIRNGQPKLDDKGWVHNIEDISNDISSIYMTSNQQLSNFTPASLNQKSFGANLVKVKTIQEQLEDNFEEPLPIEVKIEEETNDFENIQQPSTSTPPPLPEPEENTDDPFGDYAEELLDNPGIMEVSSISGTEKPDDKDDKYDDDKVGEVINNNEIQYNTPIISKRNSNFKVTLHKPKSAYDLKNQIDLQEESNRVKYLVIHTTAGNLADTHLDLAYYFMQTIEGVGYTRHGYHISIDSEGKCVQIYEDDKISYGVGSPRNGSNQSNDIGNDNTINISWIGGLASFDMTKNQANALNELVKFYQTRYPQIQIVGHNQITAKDCPLFTIPSYCKQLGIPDDNIYFKNHSGVNLNKFGTNHIKVATIFK